MHYLIYKGNGIFIYVMSGIKQVTNADLVLRRGNDKGHDCMEGR